MTKTKKPVSKDRVVYEVKGPHGTRQIDATTTAELKTQLSNLLPLDPYSVQAAAHLAHVDRATVTGQGWSVRRLGVLSFVPDVQEEKREEKKPPVTETPEPVRPEIESQSYELSGENTELQ